MDEEQHRREEDRKKKQEIFDWLEDGGVVGGHSRMRDAKERAYSRRRRQTHRLECRTYEILKNAVEKGLIEKKDCCECCGANRGKDIVAHHNDYSKPLAVVWLCKSCHSYYHYGNEEAVEVVDRLWNERYGEE